VQALDQWLSDALYV